MIGWRGRLGFLLPPGNPTVEPEMTMLAPAGVSLHFHRLAATRVPGAVVALKTMPGTLVFTTPSGPPEPASAVIFGTLGAAAPAAALPAVVALGGDTRATVIPVVFKVSPTTTRTLKMGVGAEVGSRVEAHGVASWDNRNFLGGLRHFVAEAKPGFVINPLTFATLFSKPTTDVKPLFELRLGFREFANADDLFGAKRLQKILEKWSRLGPVVKNRPRMAAGSDVGGEGDFFRVAEVADQCTLGSYGLRDVTLASEERRKLLDVRRQWPGVGALSGCRNSTLPNNRHRSSP